MRVLSFSLDQNLAKQDTPVAKRVSYYGSIVDSLLILVPAPTEVAVDLVEKIKIKTSGGRSKVRQLWRLYQLARQSLTDSQFDLITVQDTYYLALVAWWLARCYHLPLEIQVHGFEKFDGLRKIIARFILKRADGIRVVSQRLKCRLEKEFNIKTDLIYLLPVPIEIKSPANVVPYERKSNQPFVFLTISRLVPVKNISLQIEALALVLKDGYQAILWIVSDGPERSSLVDLATRLGVMSQVVFWGWQDEVSNFLARSDFFLLTSQAEGWNMTLREAAAYGRPIITTDVSPAGEIFFHNQEALIIPFNDSNALARAMEQLMDDQGLGERLAQAAKQAVNNLPDMATMVVACRQQWEKLITSQS